MQEEESLAPFSIEYSNSFPALLAELSCSLAISTYQAGKVVIIGQLGGEKLFQLPKSFRKPMGITVSGRKIAIATLDRVEVFADAPPLAKKYPGNPGVYDALFMPRATYYSGATDIHDVAWGNEGLWAVTTGFSCLSLINDDYSFVPKWQPHFISALFPEDRCHLNGMAMKDGAPEYVTALGLADSREGWRQAKAEGGLLMHVPTNTIVMRGLAMPHSPRLLNGWLYVLQSGTGELLQIHPETYQYQVVATLPGLARGMSYYNGYLFIGLSKIRTTSTTFQNLPVSERANQAGVVILNATTFEQVAIMRYRSSVDEIYDVQVLPHERPGLVSPADEVHSDSIAGQGLHFWRKPRPAESQQNV